MGEGRGPEVFGLLKLGLTETGRLLRLPADHPCDGNDPVGVPRPRTRAPRGARTSTSTASSSTAIP